ncbi:MAG TPA: hypothetical protein VIM05_06870 [Gaiellaceae bacterium]
MTRRPVLLSVGAQTEPGPDQVEHAAAVGLVEAVGGEQLDERQGPAAAHEVQLDRVAPRLSRPRDAQAIARAWPLADHCAPELELDERPVARLPPAAEGSGRIGRSGEDERSRTHRIARANERGRFHTVHHLEAGKLGRKLAEPRLGPDGLPPGQIAVAQQLRAAVNDGRLRGPAAGSRECERQPESK